MSAATLAAPPLEDVAALISQLGIAADYVLCVSCRSADTRDCQAEPQRCCPDCNHPMPAADIAGYVRHLRAALDKATTNRGA